MKRTFLLGAAAGIASLAVAVPLVAQMTMAASSSSVGNIQATVSQAAAEKAALLAHPGKITEATKLDSRFGGYKIEVTGTDGNEYDVVVDATTGKVSDSRDDGQDGHRNGRGQNEPDEKDGEENDGPDQNDENEADEQGDQSDTNEPDEVTQTTSSAASQAQQ